MTLSASIRASLSDNHVSPTNGATLPPSRTRLAAAYALFPLMIGGLWTHLTHGEYLFALMPIAYGSGLYLVMKDSLCELLSDREPIRGAV